MIQARKLESNRHEGDRDQRTRLIVEEDLMVLNDSAESTSELVNSLVWTHNFYEKQINSKLKSDIHQDPKEY